MMKKKPSQVETQLLNTISQFVAELESKRAIRALSLDASLEHDLGIDSLEKAELLHRIEQSFEIHLPVKLLREANLVKDLIPAILLANPPLLLRQGDFSIRLSKSRVNPNKAKNLTELLNQYAEHEPKRPHIYLQDDSGYEKTISYGQLYEKASLIARGLQTYKLQAGETVAIMLPTSEELFYAFFATLLIGCIVVPIYPPLRPDQIEAYTKREAKILNNAQVRVLISFQKAKPLTRLLRPFIPSLKVVTTVDNLSNIAIQNKTLIPQENEAALIQYTSGTTGDPKGVLLNHQSLLSNIHAIGQALKINANDEIVSWLPLYHDMGLIGSWLGSFYYGTPITILSPLSFLMRPERWLWALHYHRATLSAAPNFAYEICFRKIDEESIQGLDLSAWRVALNGAEAISATTLRNFSHKFAPYGFKAETFFPAYGLAESSVALVFPPINRKPKIDKVDEDSFEKKQWAKPTSIKNKSFLEFVSCGSALPQHQVRLVDHKNHEVEERHIGMLQFKGPSSMQGYYHNEAATRASNHQGWWESGDLAYQADGEIYITGRQKDLIITAGRNLYPERIEEISSTIATIRKGSVAAFGVYDATLGTEKLVIVAETKERNIKLHAAIKEKINHKVNTELNVLPSQVILVPPKTLDKTSSGKLKRAACKQAFIEGKLTKKPLPTWLQLDKLLLTGLVKQSQQFFMKSIKAIYSAYAYTVLAITVLPTWLFASILSRPAAAHLVRTWARVLLTLIGCPVSIAGKAKLNKRKTMIFIANHASYIDAIALLTMLPLNVAFIAKAELARQPIFASFFKKLGYLTVNRLDFSQNIVDTEKIKQVLLEKKSLLFFPEGTFTYASGLRTFKSGAFKLAVDTRTPLCPIGLVGTRQILCANEWLLSPKAISIRVGGLIYPQTSKWTEVARLRKVARSQLAHLSGEQAID